MKNLSLQRKVALITGGRTGIGRAIALAFAEEGADVAICGRTGKDELERVAEKICKLGRRALAITADVSCKADVENMVAKTVAELGDIDILVNNAAVLIPGNLFEIEEEVWDQVMDINLKGCFICSQTVGRMMMERKKGCIINIASSAGLYGCPEVNAYSVSKAGVIMLTRVLSRTLGSYNVRVNAIAPGYVMTKMSEEVWIDPQALKERTTKIAMRRMAQPSEIANVALFLSSDASSYITGHTILADGGFLA